MHFNGSFISVSTEGFTLDITEPLSRVQPVALEDARRKSPTLPATLEEIRSIRSLAGSLNFIGQAACPPATFVASSIQQRLGSTITVATALQANAMLKELQQIPSLLFFPLTKSPTGLRLIAMSDASFAPTSRYGQSGILIWLTSPSSTIGSNTLLPLSPSYLIEWHSCKQRRIANSSLGAEILAASHADDMLFGITRAFATIVPAVKLSYQLLIDSRSLLHLISTFKHSGTDPRLAAVVDRLRDSFFTKYLDKTGWIPGIAQLADSLTKRNPSGLRALIIAAGASSVHLPNTAQLRGSAWRNATSELAP
jgi:hypothetical protein